MHKFQKVAVCAVILFSSCRIHEVRVSPEIRPFQSMAGFVSLKISTNQQSARSRFSFFFRLPGEGSLEALDPLGRVQYRILIVNHLSFLALPAKKVFWRGGDTEILEKFLGFPLRLEEVAALLSGHWPEIPPEDRTAWQRSWNLQKDKKGRIQSGSRGEFQFRVEERFAQSPLVQTVVFFCAQLEGRAKILDVHFDQPASEAVFSTAFLEGFTEVSWAEMEKLLNAQN